MVNIDVSFNLFGYQKDVLFWASQPTKLFNRFCYVKHGSTVYSDKDEVVKLEEGNVYLLPIKIYDLEETADSHFDHVWAHFIIRGLQFDNVIKISFKNDPVLKNYIEIIDYIITTYSLEQVVNQENYVLNYSNNYFGVISGLLNSFLLYYFLKYYKKSQTAEDFSDVLDYIYNNIDKTLSNDDLAKISMYNRNYFIDKFKQTFGMTPQKYVLKSKISEAIYLLSNNHKIEELAYKLGYDNSKSFSRAFKREIGVSPYAYKSHYLSGLKTKKRILDFMHDNFK